MANRRVLIRRRKSVRNIRKITRTMQLIATARFQVALNRATASKPYTEKLTQLVQEISSAADSVEHPLMHAKEEARGSALLVLTSKRGLCGGYNTHVLRAAIAHLDKLAEEEGDCDVSMVGKKGVSYFRFLRRPIAKEITNISEVPRFEEIEPIAHDLMEAFAKGEIASAHVAYTRFVSTGKQQAEVLQLLPLEQDAVASEQQQGAPAAMYDFSPEPKTLLDELFPATVRARLFQCFNDAVLSEHVARMVAMKAATDAAGDMITMLTRKYNRARQTQITMELLDIVGGANALA